MIIGLTGNKGAGKTTAFNFIKAKYPDIIELQLAKYLKEVCSIVFETDIKYFEDSHFKELVINPAFPHFQLTLTSLPLIYELYGLKLRTSDFRKHLNAGFWTPRQVLQYVGTEILREREPTIHIRKMVESIQFQTSQNYIITDIRFINEYNTLKTMLDDKLGFDMIYIQRDEAEAKAGDHKSESEIKEIAKNAKIVNNNNGLEELKERVLQTAENVLKRNYGIL